MPPQHVRAWRTGAAGERAVARWLDRLVEHGVQVLHDRRMPGSPANIDHLAVSGSGVYVVDAKKYQGTVKLDWSGGLFIPRRYKLTVGRRDATKLVVGVQHQVELVRAELQRALPALTSVPVTGVLAFVDAEWLLFPPKQCDGVLLEGSRSAVRLIRRPGPLTPAEVTSVAVALGAAFPEA